jgi:DNA-binding MarR family transcriptional regulator
VAKERVRRSDRLASDVREVASALIRRLRAASADQVLSMSQVAVLFRLQKSGPSTIADLARREHVTPQSMGATVASLEEGGLVARRADPNDARRWNAFLTEAGTHALLAGRAARQAWLAHAIAERLSDEEQCRVGDAVALLRKIIDE